MALDIICDDKILQCSHTYWHKIKTNILRATFDHIKNEFDEYKPLYKITDTNDENYIGIGSYYDYYKNNITTIINDIDKETNTIFYYMDRDMQLDNTIKIFMSSSSEFKNLSALNYFDLGGLFALCNQSDCDGYYTPGNSLDICLLLDKIKPFMRKYEGYDCIYNSNKLETSSIYEIFENSYKKLINVSIC